MPNLGAPEIIILLVVVVLLFGATRLPKAAEGIGKALKVFKREVNSSSSDQATAESTVATAQQPAQAPAPQQSLNAQSTQAPAPQAETPDETQRRLAQQATQPREQ